MRKLGLLLFLLPLGGCSYTVYLSGADENGGTVNFVTDKSQDVAAAKATEHCRQYNREARIVVTDLASGTMTFVCQGPQGATVPNGGV